MRDWILEKLLGLPVEKSIATSTAEEIAMEMERRLGKNETVEKPNGPFPMHWKHLDDTKKTWVQARNHLRRSFWK